MEALTDSLIYLGGNDIELKYLGGTKYLLSGSLVLFGDGLKSADFVDDWFGDDTDYDLREDGTGETTVYYNHGQDPIIGKAKLGNGKGKLTRREKDIWLEHELDVAREYDEMVVQLIQQRQVLHGKSFGLSSGVAPHLVERIQQSDGSYKITKWTLGSDASVTLIPNDWRQVFTNSASLQPVKNIAELLANTTSTKSSGSQTYSTNITYADDGTPNITISNTPYSVISSNADDEQKSEAHPEDFESDSAADVNEPVQADDSNTKSNPIPKVEVITMTEQTEPVQTPVQNDAPPVSNPNDDALKALIEAQTQTSRDIATLMKYVEEAPRIQRSGYISDMGGGADPNIKNTADFLKAIERGDGERLKSVYGVMKAQTEGSGSSGGWYVGEQTLQIQFPNLNLGSALPVTRLPVSQPSGNLPIPNYTLNPSAAGQTAEAMGIASQARAEGGAYVEESILLEKVNYLVSDATSGYVKASRELMRDYAAIEGLLRLAIQRDVASREEYFILNGTGVSEPLGILNWTGTIDVAEDTDNTFVHADALEMVAHLHSPTETSVMWVHHPSIITSIGSIEVGTGGAVFHSDVAGALRTSFIGYGRMKSQHLPQIGTDGYIVLGDWSQYYLFEHEGLYIEFSDQADFLNGNVVWRFGKRFDGKPLMTDKVTLSESGNWTVSPFVAIQNKT